MAIDIKKVAYHRNGVSGAPFHVITFVDDGKTMVGIVFDEPSHVAVFDQRLLGRGTIAFGENSWRGDRYEQALRRAIIQYNAGTTQQFVRTHSRR